MLHRVSPWLVQAADGGDDRLELPDYDTITRRKQFRGKKDWANAKKQNRETKKVEKEQLRLEKEQAKIAKTEAKRLEKIEKEKKKGKGKGGRSAAKKKADAKDKAAKKKGKVQGRGGCKKKNLDAAASPDFEKKSEDSKSPRSTNKQKRGPGRLAKLRKLATNWCQKDLPPAPADEEGDGQWPEGEEEVEQAIEPTGAKGGEAKELHEAESAKTPRTQDAEIDGDGEAAKKTKKQKQSKKKSPKKNRKGGKSARCKKSQQEKANKSQGRKAKEANKKPAKAEKKPKRPTGAGTVDEDAKEKVLAVLRECNESHCTHPSWEPFQHDDYFQVSIYWSRQAVGVKVLNDTQTKSKGREKSKKKASRKQIAYFSCPTTCTYSNMCLAHLYAPCQTFRHVVRVMRLLGESCKIVPTWNTP